MPGRRNGLYSFNREAISVCAPARAGVYTLYHLTEPVFVGESDNIRKALLHHETDIDLRLSRHRPTGFVYETCATRKRKQKVDNLIERLHPALQSDLTSPEPARQASEPTVNEFPLDGPVDSDPAGGAQFAAHEPENPPPTRRRVKEGRVQSMRLGIVFCASVVVSFSLGAITGAMLQRHAPQIIEPTFAWVRVLWPAHRVPIELAEKDLAANHAGGELAIRIPWPASQRETPPPAENSALSPAASAPRNPAEGIDAKTTAIAPATPPPAADPGAGAETTKKWSVQIASEPVKEMADALAQRVLMAGYDAYVVQGKVNGQTYFRVRVGRLEDHDEAELLRQYLIDQEGYPDAFLIRY